MGGMLTLSRPCGEAAKNEKRETTQHFRTLTTSISWIVQTTSHSTITGTYMGKSMQNFTKTFTGVWTQGTKGRKCFLSSKIGMDGSCLEMILSLYGQTQN